MKLLKCLASIFLLVGLAHQAGGKDNMAFHALIVSAETSYLKTEVPLNYAELDADRVARAMRKAGRTPRLHSPP